MIKYLVNKHRNKMGLAWKKIKIQWFSSDARYLEELSGESAKKLVKFPQKLVKFQHKSARKLKNLRDFIWNIVKQSPELVTKKLLNFWGRRGALFSSPNLPASLFPKSIYLKNRLRYSRERAPRVCYTGLNRYSYNDCIFSAQPHLR